jgi:hypothetical protein
MRALAVEEPPLAGDDVSRLQAALGIQRTGVYDATAAAAVKEWKWRAGFRPGQVNGTISARAQAWLLGERSPPPRFAERAGQRQQDAELAGAIDEFIDGGTWRILGDSRYAARSPLVRFGGVFVRVGRRQGVDPRFLVAIATHENRLGTFKAIQAIHNTFGLGPGREYSSWEANIRAAATNLARPGGFYVGKNTIRTVGLTWAPLGAGNDPNDLNQHWVGSVTRFYTQLGGADDMDAVIKTRP